MKTDLRKAQFVIETFPGEIFEGFTLDEDWNGWVHPYFSMNEAKRILEIHNANGGSAQYDESNDVFIFVEGEEVFPSVEIEGMKLYPIGSSFWIWEEFEEVEAAVR